MFKYLLKSTENVMKIAVQFIDMQNKLVAMLCKYNIRILSMITIHMSFEIQESLFNWNVVTNISTGKIENFKKVKWKHIMVIQLKHSNESK